MCDGIARRDESPEARGVRPAARLTAPARAPTIAGLPHPDMAASLDIPLDSLGTHTVGFEGFSEVEIFSRAHWWQPSVVAGATTLHCGARVW